jgi:hypothetical protein
MYQPTDQGRDGRLGQQANADHQRAQMAHGEDQQPLPQDLAAQREEEQRRPVSGHDLLA